MNNDLILLTDIPSIVQTASVKHGLNKAQTKALARLEQVSDKAFHDVTQKGSIPLKDQNNNLLPKLALNEFSAREIQAFRLGKNMICFGLVDINGPINSFYRWQILFFVKIPSINFCPNLKNLFQVMECITTMLYG
ncbi:MAG: hypothetical protein KKD21_01255 [Proteobacteria bacterium]|nr:hypothetical protein [Pseudomonadota bacterium]